MSHHNNCKQLIRECHCLTLKQVSDKWNVPESTLREKWLQGDVPSFFKIFGRVKTFECWFKIWLKEHQLGKAYRLSSVFPRKTTDELKSYE